MAILQITGIADNIIIQWGALGILIVVISWIALDYRKQYKNAVKVNEELTKDAIEALTLANRAMEVSEVENKDTQDKIDNLHKDLLTKTSCKYDPSSTGNN